MKKRVYIETSIPSFYYETREQPDMVARRDWTREWWGRRDSFELLTSDAVRYELERGDFPGKGEAVALIAELPALDIVEEIIQAYTARKVMPLDPLGDALHLAIASFHKCDDLLTWNCRNLANPNKFGHIRITNALLGLFVPELVTPYQLLEESR